MKILMLGWELPPLISGGLGPACQGIFRALRQEGVDVSFVVPHAASGEGNDSQNIISAQGTLEADRTGNWPSPYTSVYGGNLYGKHIIHEVERFALSVGQIGRKQAFDIIHAHDWVSFKAGVLLKKTGRKPLLVHIHSIEHDRNPANPDPEICELEREGLLAADSVIAVSRYTRQRICDNYPIDPRKVKVIHNAGDDNIHLPASLGYSGRRPKTVLFVGRLTAQKGPRYFLLAAEKVLKLAPDIRFLMAGDGDERSQLEKMVKEMHIEDRVLFAGFLSQFDLNRVYTLAKTCVMTSVSEPFGLVALEAMSRGVPVIVPRYAGVTEVVRHCLRVDYWDIDAISAAILAVVNNRDSLADELVEEGIKEVKKLTWKKAAMKLIRVYRRLLTES